MNLQPTGDKVVVYVPAETESVTSGGIVTLARSTQELSYRKATALAVGTGRRTKMNVIVPPDINVGDTVYILRYQGMSIAPDSVGYDGPFNPGDEIRLVLESDIALVTEEEKS
jgi:co-chaperonin GroES (HSP10)